MQLGMIGLGRMGANMVRRLMRGGHDCVVHDVSADGVTFCHVLPSLVVTWTKPSSVPTQTIGTSKGDGDTV